MIGTLHKVNNEFSSNCTELSYGHGIICISYCVSALWDGGNQPVALLRSK